MRKLLNINQGWLFSKDSSILPTTLPEGWDEVNVPHSWNSVDGQDGGNDFYRGLCYYVKKLNKSELPVADCYFLELQGANSSSYVYLNGNKLASHDGGYSTFRVDLTNHLQEENILVVGVDNTANDRVYPQMADFTFYGGLYRDVNLYCVNKSHFDLEYYGGFGLQVTPTVSGSDASVEIKTYVSNRLDGQKVRYTILNKENEVVCEKISEQLCALLEIKDVTLWHGRKNPYLYTAKVELLDAENVLDEVTARFGCRTFEIDPERGFILNGEEYPLRGVSRHQDRWGYGNALLKEHHEEDMDLICEVGATTIRLAHYQHDQYFYDLCDERGMVIWAEIPYISSHMPGGRENTISQMKELVVQNYNHPSIVVWGLSNEITMGGEEDPDLLENHRILNDLVHEMDKTRLTTMACVTMCSMDATIAHLSDVVSYNHYFGWYFGETDMNGPWFDKFHEKYPNRAIGCSEYGCEALNWHTSHPTVGDYTEEYQSYYHEELIKQLFTRKYLWATHVWNMFDFGADSRAEGGENGQNHKGLVTFDRKYKKDSFYAYKAWLSDEPFVHLCGKRYVDRVEEVTKVTVYSNQKEVELFANGVSLGVKTAEDHFFYFEVPNTALETKLVAVSGDLKDESLIRKVAEINKDYILQDGGAVINWFEITAPAGRLSLNNTMAVIWETLRGKLLLIRFALKINKMRKKNAKNNESGKDESSPANAIKFNKDMLKMILTFTIPRLAGMAGMLGISFEKEELLKLNKKLNKIKIKNKENK